MSVDIGNIGSSAQLVGANTEADTYSATVTVSAGSVLLIAHSYAFNSGVAANTPTLDDSSSVSTLLGKTSAGSGDHHLNLWWCAPTAGSRTVSLTQSRYARGNLVLVELTGADTMTPFGTPATTASSGNSPSVNVTSMGANDLALAFSIVSGCDAGWSLIVPGRTEGAGQTSLFNRSSNDAQGNYRDIYTSISATHGTGSVAVSYTYTGAPFYLLAGVRVIAASGGGDSDDGLPPFFFFD